MSGCEAFLGLQCPLFSAVLTALAEDPSEKLKDTMTRWRACGRLHVLDFMVPLCGPDPVPLVILRALEILASMFNPDDTFLRGMAAFFGSHNAANDHVSLTASGRRRLAESAYETFRRIDVLVRQATENPTTWQVLTAWPERGPADFVVDFTTAVLPASCRSTIILGDPMTISAPAEYHGAILQTIHRKWPRTPVPDIDEISKHLKFRDLFEGM